jgi:hypothetical protein
MLQKKTSFMDAKNCGYCSSAYSNIEGREVRSIIFLYCLIIITDFVFYSMSDNVVNSYVLIRFIG